MGGLWEGLKKSLPCSNPLYIGVSSDYGRDEGFFSMSCKEKGLIIWWLELLFITLYTIFDVLNEIIKRCA